MALRRLLEAGTGSQSDSEEEDTDPREQDQLRHDVLVGHLLALATGAGQAAFPPHALSALAAHLESQGLLAR